MCFTVGVLHKRSRLTTLLLAGPPPDPELPWSQSALRLQAVLAQGIAAKQHWQAAGQPEQQLSPAAAWWLHTVGGLVAGMQQQQQSCTGEQACSIEQAADTWPSSPRALSAGADDCAPPAEAASAQV